MATFVSTGVMLHRPVQSRTGRESQVYNPETGARIVAGCVCLSTDHEKVVMILSSAHKNKWVLPKGGVELDEVDDYSTAAERETWEEAGVEGCISRKLPTVMDSRGHNAPIIKGDFDPVKLVPKSEFHFYEMVVDQLSIDWPECQERQRRWCTFSEAIHELQKAKRPELILVLEASSILKDTY